MGLQDLGRQLQAPDPALVTRRAAVEAEGDVARFNALLTEYSKAPQVTRRRIHIETMQDILPGIHSKIIIDEHASSFLPLLNLGSTMGAKP